VAEAPAPADPERALSLAYAPPGLRPALSALWRLDERLANIVAQTGNPALGQMRLTWWHDALVTLQEVQPVDPLLRELRESGLDAQALLPLIDGWEVLLDELPLAEAALERFAQDRGGTLFQAVASLLVPRTPFEANGGLATAGQQWALVDLAFRISDRTTATRAMALARSRQVNRRWPRKLRALGMLSRLAEKDAQHGLDVGRRQGSPRRIARTLLHALTGL
jgi:15-cis-phytoene synthase